MNVNPFFNLGGRMGQPELFPDARPGKKQINVAVHVVHGAEADEVQRNPPPELVEELRASGADLAIVTNETDPEKLAFYVKELTLGIKLILQTTDTGSLEELGRMLIAETGDPMEAQKLLTEAMDGFTSLFRVKYHVETFREKKAGDN